MSKTYRRKNAWNKDQRCAEKLVYVDNMIGHRTTPFRTKGLNQFCGWSKEEMIERTESMFHSDGWLDEQLIKQSYRKGWTRYVRRIQQRELNRSLSKEEGDNLLLVDFKNCPWWYGYAYFY